MWVLLEDERIEPAHYGAVAALLANELQAELVYLPAVFDTGRFADAVQHVDGGQCLSPSGLIWADRVGNVAVFAALDVASVARHAVRRRQESGNIAPRFIIPIHPVLAGGMKALAQLQATAAHHGFPIHHYRVYSDVLAGIDRVVDLSIPDSPREVGFCRRDAFGRWSARFVASAPQDDARWLPMRFAAALSTGTTADATQATQASQATDATDAWPAQLAASTESAERPCRVLRIALIGSEAEQRDGYPATLAALGDTADALGLTLDVRFIPAQSVRADNVATQLDGIDGVLLPGGADMDRVAGQIAVAQHTLSNGQPTVGLCLGMQSMATAAARAALGTDDVGLAEVDPEVRILSFIPIVPGALPAFHRLGIAPMRVEDGSRLASLLRSMPRGSVGPEYGNEAHSGVRDIAHYAVHYNHRYRLNPDLYAVLESVGVRVCAWDQTQRIADAIEARDHPFYFGMQGHPELASRVEGPHPLLVGFLRAAAEGRRC